VLISTSDWNVRVAGLTRPAPAAPPAVHDVPAEKHERPPLDTAYAAARSDTEALIASIWEEMLGVSPIGVEDDFFALGGHSLLAIQVVARLREHIGVEVPVQLLFDAPTVSQLAARVKAAVEENGDAPDRLAEVMEYVAQLSDEEVRRLLSAGRGEQA